MSLPSQERWKNYDFAVEDKPLIALKDPKPVGRPSGRQAVGSFAQVEAHATAATPRPATDAIEAAGRLSEDASPSFETKLAVAALLLTVFLAALDTTIITTAIPAMAEELDAESSFSWIASSYLLANAATAPSWGKIADIFGRKPVLMAAVGVFWAGSLLSGTAANIAMLIVGRAVEGIGGGGALILVNICISDMFSERKRGIYLGFVGMMWALAGGLGPALGGIFTSKISWRWCFYINLPLVGFALVVLQFALKLPSPKTSVWQRVRAVDWLGAITIIVGVLMVLMGLQFGGRMFPWTSPAVISMLAFGLVVLGIFLLVETYVATNPMIPLKLFSSGRNLAILGISCTHGFLFIAASYFIPLYFQGVLGVSPLQTGVDVLPYTLTLGAASASSGFIIKKTGRYMPLIIGAFAVSVLGYALLTDLGATANWAKLVVFQMVLGLGVGPNFQSPLIAMQSGIAPAQIAAATGTYMFVRQLAASVSIVAGGVIFAAGMHSQAPALVAQLGEHTAELLTGDGAITNGPHIAVLPEPQRTVAQAAFWQSLRLLFIFYAAMAGLGFLISLCVKDRALSDKRTQYSVDEAAEDEARLLEKGEINNRKAYNR